jgi:hypothetical protein
VPAKRRSAECRAKRGRVEHARRGTALPHAADADDGDDDDDFGSRLAASVPARLQPHRFRDIDASLIELTVIHGEVTSRDRALRTARS